MNIRTKNFSHLVLALGLMSGAAQAALFDRGGGLIYDDVLDVTWLSDAQYAKSSGYDADGLLDGTKAAAWTADLSYYDSVRKVTYTDWRLPNVNTPSGEMEQLFYQLFDLVAYVDFEGLEVKEYTPNLANTPLFQNIPSHFDFEYWTDQNDGYVGLVFLMDRNNTFVNKPVFSSYGAGAWAVRSGDVAAVPEAGTWAMLLVGLVLVGGVTKRRRRGCIIYPNL